MHEEAVHNQEGNKNFHGQKNRRNLREGEKAALVG
jgi:hypothetical protein